MQNDKTGSCESCTCVGNQCSKNAQRCEMLQKGIELCWNKCCGTQRLCKIQLCRWLTTHGISDSKKNISTPVEKLYKVCFQKATFGLQNWFWSSEIVVNLNLCFSLSLCCRFASWRWMWYAWLYVQRSGYHYFIKLSMYHANETDEHIISKIFIRYRLIVGKITFVSCWI